MQSGSWEPAQTGTTRLGVQDDRNEPARACIARQLQYVAREQGVGVSKLVAT